MIARLSTNVRVPIRLVDSSGNPVTGKLPTDVLGGVATLVKSDGTTVDITLTNSSNWFEIHSTKAPGLYHILVTATNLGVYGPTQLSVQPATSGFIGTIATFDVEDIEAQAATAATQATTAATQATTAATQATTAATQATTAATQATTAATEATIGASLVANRVRELSETKQSSAHFVTVRLINSSTGAAITGAARANVTLYYLKYGQTTATLKTLGVGDWIERDATNEPGFYDVQFSTGELDTMGPFFFSVAYTSGPTTSYTYYGVMNVVANLASDIYSRLGAPTGASVSADIATATSDIVAVNTKLGTPAGASVSADIATAQATITDVQNFTTGNWKVFASGPDANRLVLYMPDGVTVYRKFDLKNVADVAAITNVTSRTKV